MTNSEPKKREPQPSLKPDQIARFDWARHDRRPLIDRLTEALDTVDYADRVVTELRQDATHGV